MNLAEIIVNESIPHLSHLSFTWEDFKLMMEKNLLEVPIVMNNQLVGYTSQSTIVEDLFVKPRPNGVNNKSRIIPPDVKININDEATLILEKIIKTQFRIVPIFDQKDNYLGSIRTRSLFLNIENENGKLLEVTSL